MAAQLKAVFTWCKKSSAGVSFCRKPRGYSHLVERLFDGVESAVDVFRRFVAAHGKCGSVFGSGDGGIERRGVQKVFVHQGVHFPKYLA